MEAPDREHRDRARLSLESSVIVEAGAGTGKTTLLTDRILFLVLAGERPARVEEVVALTFTEKAAGEIKVRLSERLAELSARLSGGTLPPAAEERAARTLAELAERFQTPEATVLDRARAALEDLDKAPIGTIHSFCSQILRLYPVEAGVDPAFRVDADERGMKELFASEWARWLDDELGERPPRRAAWLELLSAASLEDVESLARDMSSEKLDPETAGGRDLRSAEELRELARRTAALRAKPAPKGRSRIMEALEIAEKRLLAAAEAAAAEEPPLGAPEPPELPDSKWPKPWEEDEEGARFYGHVRLVAKAASPRGEAVTRRAARLLAPFSSRLRLEYARRGWVSNDGLLRRARDLLRDAPRPREELKRRYRTLLIDEFQDTDPVQGELLLYLSEAPGRAARTWKDVVPAPGRIFIVGDPKQSIYRFRGADIFAYEGFVGRLTAADALACDLTANFRSVPGVIGPVNDVFSRIMTLEAGVQPVYKGISAAKAAAAGGPAVQAVAVIEPDGKVPAAVSQKTEALWIARRILEEERAFKDSAVLMRSSTVLPHLLDAFKSHGIPYAVEIERDFYAAAEIGDLLNLLGAIDDPEDRIAIAGLLRSPLAALPDDALLSLSRAGALDYRGDPPPNILPEDERRAASRLFSALRSLRARAGRAPLGELVAAAFLETRLPELAARAYHGQQTISNLLKLQRQAAEASELRGATLKGFIAEVLDASEETRGEGESPLADEHLDAVRVMTMHKSKGLEFPVVFAMNLSSSPKAGSRPALRTDWRTGGVSLRVGKAASAAAALAEAREEHMESRESVRVLYVAMTRAKEKLYLLGREKAGNKSLSAHLDAAGAWPAGGLAGGLPALFVEAGKLPEPEGAGPARAGSGADAEATGKAWAARARHRAGTERPRARAATGYLGEAPKRPAPPGEVQGGGAEVGQLCHLVLQGWDYRMNGDVAAACMKARVLLERRAPGPRWKEAAREAAGVLAAFLASPAARELASAEILGRETPFAYADGLTVVRGAIDLVYRLDGRLVVADFKSERVDERSAPKVREKYGEQGRAYLEAIRLAWGETAEFRLLFLRRPEL